MLLIGGAKLKELGSDRHTDDLDYLICDENSKELFITGQEGVDYINAAQHEFYAEIWKAEKDSENCSIQSLAEMKAFAFVQHCKNMNFRKADASEYDLKFLFREYGVKPSMVKNHVDAGAWSEIVRIFK